MKGDFTRITFKRENNYNSVRMQQGRVQLDADWNETMDIGNHLKRTESTDVIGASGAPREHGGFKIEFKNDNLNISAGRLFVDGILCENDAELRYTDQKHLPGQGLPTDPGLYLVYTDVWERHITAVEDPAIREVALGGPDTATRVKTIWQVKHLQVAQKNDADAELTCWDDPQELGSDKLWIDVVDPRKGRMLAKTTESAISQGPCIVAAEAGYRRLENQLYRVEIHVVGETGAKFKWSRDNGTVFTGLLSLDVGKRLVTVAEPGKDQALGFEVGQWVELTDDTRVLRGEPGILARLVDVKDNVLVVEKWLVDETDLDALDVPGTATVRRWDHKGRNDQDLSDSDGALPLVLDTDIDLEDGIQIRFEQDEDETFRTGDYWLIPARAVGGDIEWPKDANDEPETLPPQGIKHHFARLALVSVSDTSVLDVVCDARPLFPALTEPDLVYVSGDGQEAMPGYYSLDGENTFQGERLPQLLRVKVLNCNRPIKGAWVRFAIAAGGGTLEPAETKTAGLKVLSRNATGAITSFVLPTDTDGEAQTYWRMQVLPAEDTNPANLPQLVQATLLKEPIDDPLYELDVPVLFGASFGVAWQDRYGGARFPYPQHEALEARTVEKALDQVRENVALYVISGDGQEIMRKRWAEDGSPPEREPLPRPLQVRVANGDWPYRGAVVRFEITTGQGHIEAASGSPEPGSVEVSESGDTVAFSVKTDQDGLAECTWTLDEHTWSQQVKATLEEAGALTIISPSQVRFNASLSVAEEVTYDGSPFPDEPHPGLTVETVEAALDQLRENTVLHYIGGDGQEARRGEQLAQPLQVRVANGQWPREGAKVHFAVYSDSARTDGTLDADGGAVKELDVLTNADGLAAVYWTPDGDGAHSQRVIATLIDPVQPASATQGMVHFSANLSVAEQVTYDGSNFPDQQFSEELPVETVEEALDQLRENVALTYVSGDGQEIMRNRWAEDVSSRERAPLPRPLQVRVANGDWPYTGAVVRFEITAGEGHIKSASDSAEPGSIVLNETGNTVAFSVKTDQDGLAECTWTLDESTWSQQLTASLMEADALTIVSPSQVRFNASLSVAEEVSYDGSAFPDLPHPALVVETVEGALDQLRENTALHYIGGDGQEARRGEQLQQPSQVRVANGQWPRKGATVRFAVYTDSARTDGALDADGDAVKELDVLTNADGLAEVYWTPDGEGAQSQRLIATLIDPVQPASATQGIVHFSANLSVAEQVTYDGSDFPDQQFPEELPVETVEEALDQLRENVALTYVSGDGQEIMRNRWAEDVSSRERAPLPHSLQVRVANGDWPYKGAVVKFDITAGEGHIEPSSGSAEPGSIVLSETGDTVAFSVKTDQDGLAECTWTLDEDTWSQQVTASLMDADALTVISPSEVRFNASLSVAEEVTYDGSPFPDEPHPGLTVETVEAALDQLRENTVLHYIGGDGQEARRGEQLAQPLQVRVANGQWPREGAKVHFAVYSDSARTDGTLDADGVAVKELDVLTNADGLAEVYWTPDGDGAHSQRVIATLIDPVQPASATQGMVHFSANLSIAEQVTYDGSDFPDQQFSEELPVETVEEALDQLRENVALYGVSGDGQEARRGETVPKPLVVRVANGDWPYAGAKVKFAVTDGDGSIKPAPNGINPQVLQTNEGGEPTAFRVDTDSAGLAECLWTLDGGIWSQQVTTSLEGLDGQSFVSTSPVRFNANLSIAEEVSYTQNSQSEIAPPPDRVQAAVDELYEKKVNRSGDTITGALTIGGNLTVNGTTTTVNTSEMVVEDNIIRVNKGAEGPVSTISGIEVYRGETDDPSKLVWDEDAQCWKVQYQEQDYCLGYGPNWIRLTEGDVVDDLHRHTQLYADNKAATEPSLIVDAEGNIGIGTNIPASKLHVNGGLMLKIGEGLELLGDNDYFGSSQDARVFRMIGVNAAEGVVDGGIAIEGYTTGDGASKHIMSLRGTGNVGIGIKWPDAVLHVKPPDPEVTAYNWLEPESFAETVEKTTALEAFPPVKSATRLLIVSSGGNGIARLISGDQAHVYLDVLDADSNTWVTIKGWRLIKLTTGGIDTVTFGGQEIGFSARDINGVRLRAAPQGVLQFSGWNGIRFEFYSDRTTARFDGRVGIGVDNPAYSLDVDGKINALEYYKNGTSLPWDFVEGGISYAGGKVGIGATGTPEYELSVMGQANITRDGIGECCSNDNFTLSLAERTRSADGTINTGHRASIQFHNAHEAEGFIQLAGGNDSQPDVPGSSKLDARRLIFGGYQTPLSGEFTGDLYVNGSINGGINAANITSGLLAREHIPDFAIEWVRGYNDRSAESGTWNAHPGWGEPKFSPSCAYTATSYVTNEGAETLDFAVPPGAKTVYMSMLAWSDTGYFDVYLMIGEGWLFHRRIDSQNPVEHRNRAGDHSGNIVTLIATGLDHAEQIRIRNRKGRIHFTGLGFSRQDMLGSFGSGFVHTDNVVSGYSDEWQAPALIDAWVNYGEEYNPAGYYRDKLGTVHLRGLVKSGEIGGTLFTLPPGYRPAYRELQAVQTADTVGRCDIDAQGNVIAVSGDNAWFSLDGITFRAA